MNKIKSGPIFIGGLDRCGKTLLRALLVSHPNIAIPQIGSNYWTLFYGQFGDLSKRDNFERCLAAMLRYTHVRLLNPDVERIRQEFLRGEQTYARLFALFNEQYAEREGKPRWGDQTGLIESYADQVLNVYAGAKMIHLLRDPRDRYQASLALHPKGKGRVGGATARWLYSVNLAERNQRRYPYQYKIVRYETLVSQPEETLQGICTFLDEKYTPSMLTMEGAPDFREKVLRGAYGNSGKSLISTEFIGRFRKFVPMDEVAFMQVIAGTKMVTYGYPLEPVRFSLEQQLKFYTGIWPLNFARMSAWLTMEAVQHNFPGYFGRKPPADKLR